MEPEDILYSTRGQPTIKDWSTNKEDEIQYQDGEHYWIKWDMGWEIGRIDIEYGRTNFLVIGHPVGFSVDRISDAIHVPFPWDVSMPKDKKAEGR